MKSQIESIRRKISHIDVVIEIKENDIRPTKRQQNIIKITKKRYRTNKVKKLKGQKAIMIHDLKTITEKQRRTNAIHKRKTINRKFKFIASIHLLKGKFMFKVSK